MNSGRISVWRDGSPTKIRPFHDVNSMQRKIG